MQRTQQEGNGRLTDTDIRYPEENMKPLRNLLCQHFNCLELHDLAASLGIRLSTTNGLVERDLARHLLQRAHTQDQLDDLLEECHILRPFVRWPRIV